MPDLMSEFYGVCGVGVRMFDACMCNDERVCGCDQTLGCGMLVENAQPHHTDKNVARGMHRLQQRR